MRTTAPWLCMSLLVAAAATLSVPAAAHDEANTTWGAGDPADHHHPDCEDNQPALGSANADGSGGLRADGEYGSSPGPEGVLLRTCEGEHWDGDDHAQPDETNPTDAHVTNLCDETLVLAVFDGPAQDDGEPGATTPLQARFTAKGDNDIYRDPDQCDDGNPDATDLNTDRENFDDLQGSFYLHVGILLVGETAVTGDGDGGSLDENDGTDRLGKARVGWYGEDWTDLVVTNNVLARVISAVGLTKGTVPETTTGDCDHDTYEQGRQTSNRELCARDNTAITVELQA